MARLPVSYKFNTILAKIPTATSEGMNNIPQLILKFQEHTVVPSKKGGKLLSEEFTKIFEFY